MYNTQMKAEVADLCKAQLSRYPATQALDLLKLLFQGEFGPGHLIENSAKSKQYLLDELNSYCGSYLESSADYVESIGFGFSRVHLGINLSLDTLHRIFELSAQSHHGSNGSFACKTAILKELCREDILPFDEAEIDKLHSEPPTPFRHSEAFRAAHSPAYRVVQNEYCRYIPLLMRIDAAIAQNSHTIVAIDGDAASGKTTLSEYLRQIYACNVIHMDHFFLRPQQRSEERLAKPGGNIDHERFKEEALEPLLTHKPFTYRPFDCQIWDFGKEIAIMPNCLTVVEGSYSHHPTLKDAYDIKVFLAVNPIEQMRRIALRNAPPLVEKFRNIWIPMEKAYFEVFDIEKDSDLQFLS